jgi:hypothetical protein
MAINRIRHYYLERAGDDARYFTLGGHDDLEGAFANMGVSDSRWRPFFSIGAVLAVINSMVSGALFGVAVDAVASRSLALGVGVAVTAGAFAVHYRAGWRRYVRAIERHTPLFPSPPASSATEPGAMSADSSTS